jgi:pyruvate dehydrogenase E2 component (dihydrolipoamide acetyltransferase)
MSFDFHLPDLAEGMTEAEIVSWKVQVGDSVSMDQPLVEVMSDKATVEIPSPRAGKMSSLNYKEGEMCAVGAVLFVIDEGGAAAGGSKGAAPAAPAATAPAASAPSAVPAPTPAPVAAPAAAAPVAASGARVLATPATRRLARELGIDIRTVAGSGKRGRVTSDDVRSARGGAVASVPLAAAVAPAPTHAPVSIPVSGGEQRVPFRGMRKKIAENMARSVQTAAHFTYVEEVDVTELVELRGRAKARGAERGVNVTYLPFIMKAVVAALKKWPALNASLDESTQEIVYKHYYHLGIAAQGPNGLMVTVVRDADRRSIFDTAAEVQRLGQAVQDGTATRDELSGSTFTISSLGKLGGVLATPIINFPEVGIMGVHKIEQKPAVRDGEIVARYLMNLSISLDHRLVDGWDGAMFLQEVKTLLEDPTLMFMEMV